MLFLCRLSSLFIRFDVRLCAGGELFDRIIESEFFSEDVAATVFKQILQALNYCHT